MPYFKPNLDIFQSCFTGLCRLLCFTTIKLNTWRYWYIVWSEILHEIREEVHSGSNKRWKHFVLKQCCPQFVLKGNYCFYKRYTRKDKSRKPIHVLAVWHILGGDVNNVENMLLKWTYLSHLDLFICWR